MSNHSLFNLSFKFSTMDDLINHLFLKLKNGHKKNPKTLLPTTANEIATSFLSLKFKKVLQNFDYLVTDGMPLVFLAKLHNKNAERLYGPDLMVSIFSKGQGKAVSHFLYGSSSRVLKNLKKQLLARFPRAKIAGMISPPFRKLSLKEEKKFIEKINKAKPNFLWVSLGGEKQATWAIDMKKNLKVDYIIPVGAAFDFISGNKAQAPVWMQKTGLEWLFRFFLEPIRLWKRYILKIPIFLVLFLLEVLKIIYKKYFGK